MVHRWRCRHCEYTVWSGSRQSTVDSIESHLLDHHRGNVSERDFQTEWTCPYCDRQSRRHTREEALAEFKSHLFDHADPLVESGVHVADDINGTGSILVQTPMGTTGASNARLHFTSPGDIVLFVTMSPEKRIQFIQEQLKEWPAWTILLTTEESPLSNVDGVDFSTSPLEVVQLDRRLGLQDLGETISRIVEEQDTANNKLVVGFDILSEVIAKFDLQTVFQFLHVLTSRLEQVDALSYFYVNKQARSSSTINVLDQLFDLSIEAGEQTFVTGRQ
jgi:hypothetical protein